MTTGIYKRKSGIVYGGFKDGNTPWNKGKKLPNYLNNRGSNHYNWKGGKTSELNLIRNGTELRKWRKAVYEYDDYTCWICETRGIKLQAHHLFKFSDYPELRLVKSNGITLCKFCHKTYTKFGKQIVKI